MLWHGKFVQPKIGAVRIKVNGGKTALLVDGILELPVGPGRRSRRPVARTGTHDLAIFAAVGQRPAAGAKPRWPGESHVGTEVVLAPFRAADFDLESPAAKKAVAKKADPFTVPLLIKAAALTRKTETFGLLNANGAEVIGNWQSADDSLKWDFAVPAPGPYEVWLDFSHEGDGGKYNLLTRRQDDRRPRAEHGQLGHLHASSEWPRC